MSTYQNKRASQDSRTKTKPSKETDIQNTPKGKPHADEKQRAREIRDELEHLSVEEKRLLAELYGILGITTKVRYCTVGKEQATLNALKALAV